MTYLGLLERVAEGYGLAARPAGGLSGYYEVITIRGDDDIRGFRGELEDLGFRFCIGNSSGVFLKWRVLPPVGKWWDQEVSKGT